MPQCPCRSTKALLIWAATTLAILLFSHLFIFRHLHLSPLEDLHASYTTSLTHQEIRGRWAREFLEAVARLRETPPLPTLDHPQAQPEICIGLAAMANRHRDPVLEAVASILRGGMYSPSVTLPGQVELKQPPPPIQLLVQISGEKDDIGTTKVDALLGHAGVRVERHLENHPGEEGWSKHQRWTRHELYDYVALLEKCVATGARFVVVVEEDTWATPHFMHKLQAAIATARDMAKDGGHPGSWMLKLFVTNYWQGWSLYQPRHIGQLVATSLFFGASTLLPGLLLFSIGLKWWYGSSKWTLPLLPQQWQGKGSNNKCTPLVQQLTQATAPARHSFPGGSMGCFLWLWFLSGLFALMAGRTNLGWFGSSFYRRQGSGVFLGIQTAGTLGVVFPHSIAVEAVAFLKGVGEETAASLSGYDQGYEVDIALGKFRDRHNVTSLVMSPTLLQHTGLKTTSAHKTSLRTEFTEAFMYRHMKRAAVFDDVDYNELEKEALRLKKKRENP